MRKLLSLASVLLVLNGCSLFHVHHMDIEQGNIITQDMRDKIHLGMSQEQVRAIAGEPVMANVFDKNRMDYVYTYKPGNGDMSEKYLTLIFRNGKLVDITGNLYSQYLK